MRKILFVTYQDFANVSSDIAHAINGWVPGWEAKVYSCLPHPFQYPNPHHFDFDVSSARQKRDARNWISDGVDIVVWAEESWPHSYYSFYGANHMFADAMLFGQRKRLFAEAKCFIFHAGVPYRSNPAVYNALDSMNFKAQIVSPDLWRLSRDQKGIVCFGKPIDVDPNRVFNLWRSDRKTDGKVVVCHSPTNRALKGTPIIASTMAKIVREFDGVEYRQIGGPAHQNQHVPFRKICEERSGCHIYIDQYSSVGGIGMSSLEAMADGMVVACTSHMIPTDAWVRAGIDRDRCPLVYLPSRTGDDVVDGAALYDVMAPLVRNSLSDLQGIGLRGSMWVQMMMSPSLFASKFLDSLEAA